jgi:lysyl-tRNA synthetase class 2
MKSYQPTCSLEAIKARAEMYNKIRQFFAERNVLEVETPVLSQAGVTDVHLASVQVQRHIHGKLNTQYLQTSPEFPMKRLLASGSGQSFKFVKSFVMMSMGVNTIANSPCWNGIDLLWI